MSSHFNYEIDERHLRVRLKEMEMPYKEDAWLQFEAFSDLNCIAGKASKLPTIRLNLNRTLILPFVFGAVIILFSLLLVNFISIKNTKTAAKKDAILLANTESASKPVSKSNPVITPPIAKIDTVKTDSVPAQKTETVSTNTVIVTPSVTLTKTIASTPTVAVITPPTPTVNSANSWVSFMASQIYESPNIASKVVGSSNGNQSYSALEETNYFIKVAFNKNGQALTGYIMKSTLSKGGQANFRTQANNQAKKKDRKAEVLEALPTPLMISGSEKDEKEPELK